MRRRTLVASIPGVLVAGCTSGGEDDPESTNASTSTPAAASTQTPTRTESGGGDKLSRSRAVKAMSGRATESNPELTVVLHEDAEVPGETNSDFVPLKTIMVADAFTRSWSKTVSYAGQSEFTVSVEPPEWPARGAAVGMNSQFDDPIREEIGFEVTQEGTVTINSYSTVHG